MACTPKMSYESLQCLRTISGSSSERQRSFSRRLTIGVGISPTFQVDLKPFGDLSSMRYVSKPRRPPTATNQARRARGNDSCAVPSRPRVGRLDTAKACGSRGAFTFNRVVKFERSGRAVAAGTVQTMKRALESAGVEFISENGSGAGVRMKKGKLN